MHNPINDLRIARHNLLATFVGAWAAYVPAGVYLMGHYELSSWDPRECPKALLVYAGLLFSVITTLGWSFEVFGSRWQALGFTALVEGIMMTSDNHALTLVALGLLVSINATAKGARLAVLDASTRPVMVSTTVTPSTPVMSHRYTTIKATVRAPRAPRAELS